MGEWKQLCRGALWWKFTGSVTGPLICLIRLERTERRRAEDQLPAASRLHLVTLHREKPLLIRLSNGPVPRFGGILSLKAPNRASWDNCL